MSPRCASIDRPARRGRGRVAVGAQPIGGRLERRENDPDGVCPSADAALADESATFLRLARPRPVRPQRRDDMGRPSARTQVRQERCASDRADTARSRSPVMSALQPRPRSASAIVHRSPTARPRATAFLGPGRRIPPVSITASDRPNQTNSRAASMRVVDVVHDGERSTPELERLLATGRDQPRRPRVASAQKPLRRHPRATRGSPGIRHSGRGAEHGRRRARSRSWRDGRGGRLAVPVRARRRAPPRHATRRLPSR